MGGDPRVPGAAGSPMISIITLPNIVFCFAPPPPSLGFFSPFEMCFHRHKSAISASQRHVSQAMYLLSSIKCNILTEVSKFHSILKLNKKQNKLPFVVGVHITEANSPLIPGSNWNQTMSELKVYEERALFYVTSEDKAVKKWFCSRYQHVVAFDHRDRTLEANGSNRMVASLLNLLNLGNTDYVIGDSTSSYTLLSKWLSSQRIVRNVLRQQRVAECVTKVPSDLFRSHDYDKCFFEASTSLFEPGEKEAADLEHPHTH